MLMVLELLVALVVGFVLGRIWEIRQEFGGTAFTGTLPTDSARSMRIDKLRPVTDYPLHPFEYFDCVTPDTKRRADLSKRTEII